MTDELMSENREYSSKCTALQQKLSELKTLHNHLGKMKGELSHKKSVELSRLIDSINRLQASL